MIKLREAIIEHCCGSRLQHADALSKAVVVSQFMPTATIRPLSKFLFKSAAGGGSISYHIPAAAAIEIVFPSRTAVNSAVEVRS
jgi:hypothetical protein